MSIFKSVSKSIGTKLSISVFISVSVLLIGLLLTTSFWVVNFVSTHSAENIHQTTELISQIIDNSDRELKTRIDQLGQGLTGSFKEQWSTQGVIEAHGKTFPNLLHGAESLYNNQYQLDQFNRMTSAQATFMVLHNGEFLRISTTLKNEKGERLLGTSLDANHPAIPHLLKKEKYIGLAVLVGKQYITQYTPLINAKGDVIGAQFVGFDFSLLNDGLKKTISEMKLGDDGFFYVLDTREQHLGKVITHPHFGAGSNLIDEKSANGTPFVKEMLEKKHGNIFYDQVNKDGSTTKTLAAFASIDGRQWLVVASLPEKAYKDPIVFLTNNFLYLGLVILVLFAIGFFFFVQKNISKPLDQLRNSANKIAQGDLIQTPIDPSKNDEIAQLAKSMNDISTGLTKVVKTVLDGSEILSNSSHEIAQGNHDLSARTEQQAGTIQQTAASMEQICTTVRNNSQSAQSANDLITQAALIAKDGGEQAQQVVETMKGITDSSKKIEDITSVIDSIAFQTNILALNAAVEAARAGEQGRGFAVVASEVRTLAQRSAEAAKEIKNLIQTSVERTQDGSALVNKTGSTIQALVQSIQEVTDVMAQISTASAQQSTAIDQVTQSTLQMDQMTQQNAALVEEMAASATSLNQQADALVKSVSVFKIYR